MFTLIGLGVSVAYAYSLVAALLPGIFPASFREESGDGGHENAKGSTVAPLRPAVSLDLPRAWCL